MERRNGLSAPLYGSPEANAAREAAMEALAQLKATHADELLYLTNAARAKRGLLPRDALSKSVTREDARRKLARAEERVRKLKQALGEG